ncbi:DUF4190 domain-containing protein [Agreia sp. COWG]|uniref:DUF4190 domain-containing protein n=1 Tax=Agreia sp. COWG TaxID=2773266 RepID=UPI001927BF20|nr:DUF4190 domain-containing protein [Agreia sp. COWG]CAD6004267.1 conserved protein of unknown function [Agreia sp. COWG]
MTSQPYSASPTAVVQSAGVSNERAGVNLPAVFALVTGLLWLSPVAIVLGHIAIAQIRRRGQSGLVMAIIGLVLGYLGLIALVVALVSLLSFVNSGPVPPTTF